MKLPKFLSKAWVVTRTIWPYNDGYGVLNRNTNSIVETGITKQEAQEIVDELNEEE